MYLFIPQGERDSRSRSIRGPADALHKYSLQVILRTSARPRISIITRAHLRGVSGSETVETGCHARVRRLVEAAQDLRVSGSSRT